MSRLSEELGWSLDLLHGHVMPRVFQYLADVIQEGEMTFSQLNALYNSFQEGPKTIAQIAGSAGLSHPAASRMVDRLVRAGLMSRTEDASDRRRKTVVATDSGLEKLKAMQQITVDGYAMLLDDMPEALQRRLLDVLNEVAKHLPAHPMRFEDQS
jgi:DNA-binding MarR family transcriptional regulator